MIYMIQQEKINIKIPMKYLMNNLIIIINKYFRIIKEKNWIKKEKKHVRDLELILKI
jgi:hypothetical protein